MRLLIGLAFLAALTASVAAVTSRISDTHPKSQYSGTPGIHPYQLGKGPLATNWTEQVGQNPWPEHPRPLLRRPDWQNLNGVWQFQGTDSNGINSPPFGVDLNQSVLVPFCMESAISGIMYNTAWSWYRTAFNVPSSWPAENRVLLNFGAVDYEATIFLNGQKLTTHTGGYFEFTVDLTDHISRNGTNELLVHVFDPTDMDEWQVPIGKQTIHPTHIFYTPCSGIWQTVWLESVPSIYISQLQVKADHEGNVDLTITASEDVGSMVYDLFITGPINPDGTPAGGSTNDEPTAKGTASTNSRFKMNDMRPWSPDSPTLYTLVVKLGNDTVTSYLGFRTISRGQVNGIERPLVNGEFVFQFGTLDQGYWPDGIYTPPSVEAMIFDLKTLKELGYNMVRKHIKVEPALWYQACDRLGLLVIQDMPSLRVDMKSKEDGCKRVPVNEPSATVEFGRQLELLVQQLRNYPSIYTWVIYNEGWGQDSTSLPHPEFEFANTINRLDGTRLVNAVTGWNDHGAGDFHDNHHYANPQCGTPWFSAPSTPYDPKRIAIQGEFGGLGHVLDIKNMWEVEKSLNEINQTYELDPNLPIWNARSHAILEELRQQIELYACSAAVWTQTTDVEGEVNGMLSYDRRILRPDVQQWRADIQALYDTAKKRGTTPTPKAN